MMQSMNIIVTGAAGGLGRATSLLLARQGAAIAALDVDRDGAQSVAREVTAIGGKAVAVVGDLTTRDGAHRLFDEAVQALGPIDGLLNNAGVYPRRPILEITDADWDFSVSVNVRGLYHMTVAAILHMQQRHDGRIVNIASIDAFKAHPKNSHYAATKAAVVSLTKSFGLEAAPMGILVNGVAPGPIATEVAKKAGFLPSLEKETALGRAAEPDDIAEVIAFLLSKHNRYMVGETVVVSGGYYIP